MLLILTIFSTSPECSDAMVESFLGVDQRYSASPLKLEGYCGPSVAPADDHHVLVVKSCAMSSAHGSKATPSCWLEYMKQEMDTLMERT